MAQQLLKIACYLFNDATSSYSLFCIAFLLHTETKCSIKSCRIIIILCPHFYSCPCSTIRVRRRTQDRATKAKETFPGHTCRWNARLHQDLPNCPTYGEILRYATPRSIQQPN